MLAILKDAKRSILVFLAFFILISLFRYFTHNYDNPTVYSPGLPPLSRYPLMGGPDPAQILMGALYDAPLAFIFCAISLQIYDWAQKK